MRVLHVSESDTSGGAARAAMRLHRGLRARGVASHMLVQDRQSDDPHVTGPASPWAKLAARGRYYAADLLLRAQTTPNPALHSLNLFPTGRAAQINATDADVVHLHWVNREMMSIAEIGALTKPVVWTLHDTWPLCGAEHYGLDSARFCDGYHSDNRPPGHEGWDLDRWTWARKRRHWADLDLRVVTPSRWLADAARRSVLFRDVPVRAIPNALCTRAYHPIDRGTARRILGLPTDALLLAFGAINATTDLRKGFDTLTHAVRRVARASLGRPAEVLIFGAGHGPGDELFGCRVHYLGRLHDDPTLALTYAAADVVVVPSRAEAFGQTASEALACGTPVVAFAATGLLDIVDHEANGYLARPFDADDLARGLRWVLTHPEPEALRTAARAKAERAFARARVAEQYLRVYRAATGRRRDPDAAAQTPHTEDDCVSIAAPRS
jgi:glycosyltransferase involved in cell wall biosynthesis